MTVVRWRRGRAAVVVGVSAALVAGCSGEAVPDPAPSASDISEVFTDVEWSDASFWLADEGMPTELVSLSDGMYVPAGSAEDGPHMRTVGDLVYVDIDGDGDRDALSVLEWVEPDGGDYTGWKGLYAWLWEDGEVVPASWPLSWQWTCAEGDDEYRFEPPDEELFRQPIVVVHRRVSNACGSDEAMGTASVESWVGIWQGLPTGYTKLGYDLPEDQHRQGATVACHRDGYGEGIEVPEGMGVPLLWPEDGSTPVTEGYTELHMWEGELSKTDSIELHNGYVPVAVTWGDSAGCGWLKWDFDAER